MNWSQDIANAIKAWVDENPKRNLSLLANRTSTSYSTVRRMAQAEREVSLETATPVLIHILGPAQLVKMFQKHFSSLDGLWEAFAKHNTVFLQDSNKIEWHQLDSDIIALATASEGVSRGHIEKEYGVFGNKRVNYLLAVGMLKEINSRIKIFSENWSDPDRRSMLKRISMRAEHYNLENLGDLAAFRTFTLEATDEEFKLALKGFLNLFLETHNKLKTSVGIKRRVFTVDFLANFINKDD